MFMGAPVAFARHQNNDIKWYPDQPRYLLTITSEKKKAAAYSKQTSRSFWSNK